MTEPRDPLVIARLSQQLRQEQELFDQRKAQDQERFRLWLAMGWTAIVLFVVICAFAGFVVLDHGDFSTSTVVAATSALLIEALGLLVAVWKKVLGKGPRELEPTTAAVKRD
jgi:hypothetical protein